MTTPTGITFARDRLSAATNLSELRQVWASLAYAYQREPEILALKNRLKARLTNA